MYKHNKERRRDGNAAAKRGGQTGKPSFPGKPGSQPPFPGQPPFPAKESTPPPKERIQLLDALRGLSILLMVAYHGGYDLVAAGYLQRDILYNPFLQTLQTIFAALFIILAGISSRFSRSNLKRGLMLLGFSLGVTAVSLVILPRPWESLCHALGFPVTVDGWDGAAALKQGLIGVPVTFGILHFMAIAILLYTLLERWRITLPFTLAFGFICLYYNLNQIPHWLSGDYFSFSPWFFLFILGTWIGTSIKEGAWPSWFYELRIPFLPFVGRHTLPIYLAHQPLLYGGLWILSRFVQPK